MTRQWTLAESRLIAERVMEWQVTEINGRLFLIDPEQRPAWMETCAVPDWPNDPAAAAMALAAWVSEGGRHAICRYEMLERRHVVTLYHQYGALFPVSAKSSDWSEAVMLAVLAGVRG